jgi:hypothetical protein
MYLFDYLSKIANRIFIYIHSPNLALKIRHDFSKIFKKNQEVDNNIFLKFENIYDDSSNINNEHENLDIDFLNKKKMNDSLVVDSIV